MSDKIKRDNEIIQQLTKLLKDLMSLVSKFVDRSWTEQCIHCNKSDITCVYSVEYLKTFHDIFDNIILDAIKTPRILVPPKDEGVKGVIQLTTEQLLRWSKKYSIDIPELPKQSDDEAQMDWRKKQMEKLIDVGVLGVEPILYPEVVDLFRKFMIEIEELTGKIESK